MSSVIQITNLSKIYRLGEIGTGTISRDLERWYKMKLRGQEDPFLKIGQTNNTSEKGISDIVYSLRDINFEVQQGEALGIIGKNGAGKSTLLKILSRVTSPTTGKINIKGRVTSLLEVGTGFHPELTGRENIYLNGAILGMRKYEITRKLDEIIDFSGVERYIDTPVKRYSSGMYVRLAFAVAAHLESEILIVDEVLAVGDAEFQKKCLGKMGDINKGNGRTILFVSHNMGAVQQLCQLGILLKNGKIEKTGSAGEVVKNYLMEEPSIMIHRINFEPNESLPISIIGVSIGPMNKSNDDLWDINSELMVKIDYIINHSITGVNLDLTVYKDGLAVFSSFDIDYNPTNFLIRNEGIYQSEVKLQPRILKAGMYTISVGSGRPSIDAIENKEHCVSFELKEIGEDFTNKGYSQSRPGLIMMPLKWETMKLS